MLVPVVETAPEERREHLEEEQVKEEEEKEEEKEEEEEEEKEEEEEEEKEQRVEEEEEEEEDEEEKEEEDEEEKERKEDHKKRQMPSPEIIFVDDSHLLELSQRVLDCIGKGFNTAKDWASKFEPYETFCHENCVEQGGGSGETGAWWVRLLFSFRHSPQLPVDQVPVGE